MKEENEYEAQRQENIRRNKLVLHSLNLIDAKNEVCVKAAQPAKKRKAPTTRAALPRRISSRLSGQQAVDYTGEKVEPSAPGSTCLYEEPASRTAEISGAAFLKDIQSNPKVARHLSSEAAAYAKTINGLSLKSIHCTKLVPNRITSLAILPTLADVIVAADKEGNFGFWQIGAGAKAVRTARLHKQPVYSMAAFAEHVLTSSYDGRMLHVDVNTLKSRTVYTAPSGDANDRRLYSISSTDKHTGTCGWVGHGSGVVAQYDLRAKQGQVHEGFQAHEKKVFTVHSNPADRHYLCTASLDRTVAIFDVRKMRTGSACQPVASLTDSALSVNSAYWSPDGTKIVSTCMDNKLRVYVRPQNTACTPVATIPHNNKTGRWLTKFQAVWEPKSTNVVLVGSMQRPRQIEAYSVTEAGTVRKEPTTKAKAAKRQRHPRGAPETIKQEEGTGAKEDEGDEKVFEDDDFFPAVAENGTPGQDHGGVFRLAQLQDDNLASVQSCVASHPDRHLIAGANSSGRVLLYR